jgi:tetratricopeptide (TPR) repeat protein
MSNPQAVGQDDIKIRIKEAEACYSMGMIADALGVYERILSGPPISDNQIQGTIKQKINQLKKEVADQEKVENLGVTAEDISLFKKTLSAHEDVPTLLDGARALKELGLLEESVAEYEKLMAFDFSKSDYSKFDYSPAKIVRDYLDCLLDIKPPQEVVKIAYKVIYKHSLKDPEIAQLKFWLGSEMEKKAQKDIAIELYQKAAEIDPKNSAIRDKINSLASKASSGSKYDYLLSQKLVTTNQLQEALSISKKISKSVEFVLIDRFKVKKEEVGKSLSTYYGCKFRSFDPDAEIPFELINKLKKSFLLYYVWVPLGWDRSGIEILVDELEDLRKTDHIKALMTNQKIYFSIGVKEDIEKYINHFFDPRMDKLKGNVVDQLDDIIPDITFEEEEDDIDDMPMMDESSSQVVKFVDQVMVTAFREGVSACRFPIQWHRQSYPVLKSWPILILLKKDCPRMEKSKSDVKGSKNLNCVSPPCQPPADSKMRSCGY